MAYEFLKKLYGTQNEGGQPKAMTYAELEAAIDADQDIQIVDLKAGGYVSKEKFDAKNMELTGVKDQLKSANAEIQSYKDMDIEGIKQKAADWETKYNADTQALNDKLDAQERSHQVDRFFDQYKFSSVPAMRGVRDEFEKKEFQLMDGKFLGAEDFMKGLMENEDYKGAFVTEEPAPSGNPDPEQQPTRFPRFSQTTNSAQQQSHPKMSLAEMMRKKNENPNYNVTFE